VPDQPGHGEQGERWGHAGGGGGGRSPIQGRWPAQGRELRWT
jgi:hypothetical protein